MTDKWKYKGPIFDAHTHIGTIDNISKMIAIEDDFGVTAQIGIVHTDEGFQAAKEQYSHRFVFAKYLSLGDIAQYNVDPVLDEISKLQNQGYSLAKSWFGPRWRDYYEEVPNDFRINHPKLDPIFQALEDNGIPLLIHMADPDTYYALQYLDSDRYGTKEEHLKQIEDVFSNHPKLKFQIPHFGAQPEIHRLPDLARWLDKFPNVVVDTASSRWMARELSKDVNKAREFMIKYSDRVLFGTDLSTNKGDRDYFSGRYIAQRILWETNEREAPLPFPDADTKDTGGTFINGLDLPLSVLSKLYWENATRIYDFQ
ncbi:MAG: amidohydrolase family protein [Candidatus Thorarchaeota archaeon]